MKVLQIIDSLDAGGAERMAVQIANELQAAGHESHICATRKEGLFKDIIQDSVRYIFLDKKGKLGLKALTRLKSYVVKHDIDIIHAHSTSFFTGSVLKWWLPNVKLIWHDHYGNAEKVEERESKILKICSRLFDGVITVNEVLKEWSLKNLKISQVVYFRNFVSTQKESKLDHDLPGIPGKRLVHLANLRPQKDHINLINAFNKILEQESDWNLLLVGMNFKDEYADLIKSTIEKLALTSHIHLLGSRNDTSSILQQCDIAVLSSQSEGLPVALLEYGMAGLPVVVTDVGACKEVVGIHGEIVPPQNSALLATSLLELIQDSEKANVNAHSFQKHVMTTFGSLSYINNLEDFYSSI